MGATARGMRVRWNRKGEVGALDLNANRGRFGYEAQPRWGVSADKLPFPDPDKQANCLCECDRRNKKKRQGEKKDPTTLTTADFREFSLIFSHYYHEKGGRKSGESRKLKKVGRAGFAKLQ